MTIKFERNGGLNHHKYPYRLTDYPTSNISGEYFSIEQQEAEQLFKDMAKELGYNIYKNNDSYITNKEFKDKCSKEDKEKEQDKRIKKLEERLDKLEEDIEYNRDD